MYSSLYDIFPLENSWITIFHSVICCSIISGFDLNWVFFLSLHIFTQAAFDIVFFMLLTLLLLKYFSYICDKNKFINTFKLFWLWAYLIKLFQKHVVCTKLNIYVLMITVYYRWFVCENGFLRAMSHQRRMDFSEQCHIKGEWISQSNVTSKAKFSSKTYQWRYVYRGFGYVTSVTTL